MRVYVAKGSGSGSRVGGVVRCVVCSVVCACACAFVQVIGENAHPYEGARGSTTRQAGTGNREADGGGNGAYARQAKAA